MLDMKSGIAITTHTRKYTAFQLKLSRFCDVFTIELFYHFLWVYWMVHSGCDVLQFYPIGENFKLSPRKWSILVRHFRKQIINPRIKSKKKLCPTYQNEYLDPDLDAQLQYVKFVVDFHPRPNQRCPSSLLHYCCNHSPCVCRSSYHSYHSPHIPNSLLESNRCS